ncbi:helix-turn-helix domain-containing protein [Vibrio brasiliensis]|uniref:helix-turn-helix domain-containing protein n=1 Tax=Vibrio brasiliensis TaxID=170652 RepID=UPI001EFE5DEA|nr:helix-turn-helix transcriptional regulator [Vibrio brasiliensis]MCG9725710.1 helix-turn-helix domain-containing protein [Vibrio brasiliensis]
MIDRRKIVNAPQFLPELIKKHKTQKSFADEVGVSSSVISKWKDDEDSQLPEVGKHHRLVSIAHEHGFVVILDNGERMTPPTTDPNFAQKLTPDTRRKVVACLTFGFCVLVAYGSYYAYTTYRDMSDKFGDKNVVEVLKQRSQKSIELCEQDSSLCAEIDRGNGEP